MLDPIYCRGCGYKYSMHLDWCPNCKHSTDDTLDGELAAVHRLFEFVVIVLVFICIAVLAIICFVTRDREGRHERQGSSGSVVSSIHGLCDGLR
jgi:hypothetical protein